jgi:hypothetical protein
MYSLLIVLWNISVSSYISKQDNQCSYNVTLMLVCVTIFAVDEHYILCVCVCSHRYSACNADMPYFYLWPVSLYYNFLISLQFWKKCTEHKRYFSLKLLSEKFLFLRRTERVVIKNVYWSSCNVPITLVWF